MGVESNLIYLQVFRKDGWPLCPASYSSLAPKTCISLILGFGQQELTVFKPHSILHARVTPKYK